MRTRCVARGWLRREVEVELPDGWHVVEYQGYHLGFEQVVVDGQVMRKISMTWFAPRFEFEVGGCPGVVEVRVWPWFLLRSLTIRVGGTVVYAEGAGVAVNKKAAGPNDWWDLA